MRDVGVRTQWCDLPQLKTQMCDLSSPLQFQLSLVIVFLHLFWHRHCALQAYCPHRHLYSLSTLKVTSWGSPVLCLCPEGYLCMSVSWPLTTASQCSRSFLSYLTSSGRADRVQATQQTSLPSRVLQSHLLQRSPNSPLEKRFSFLIWPSLGTLSLSALGFHI